MTGFTRNEIEAGRKLFAGDWQFLWAAAGMDSLPPMKGLEIAFAGRSNAGKSSLINAVTGRKALARTSHTPGRTQEIIFFQGPDDLRLADMPGYGYAEAPKDTVAGWTDLIKLYLKGRVTLRHVLLLIDGRHGVKPNDHEIMTLLDRAAVPYQVVLTKADKIGVAQGQKMLAATEAALLKHPAARTHAMLTSSEKGTGIAELRELVLTLIAQ